MMCAGELQQRHHAAPVRCNSSRVPVVATMALTTMALTTMALTTMPPTTMPAASVTSPAP
jgi:hypothetical protein